MSNVIDERTQREIAGRAQTLLERLENRRKLATDGRTETNVEDVLEEWRETFPTERAFEKRLKHLGVSRKECRESLCGNRLANSEPIPAWLERVTEVAEHVANQNLDDILGESSPDTTDKKAFWSVVKAVGNYLRENSVPSTAVEHLDEEAIDEMVWWFERRFYSRFVRILFVEFKTFVATNDEDLAFSDPDEFEELPTEYYRQFRKYLLNEGFVDLCYEYPMFARLLGNQIRQWSEHLTEFCRRIESDRQALAEQFNDSEPLGPIVDLEPLADDTHGDGRAVMRVTFEADVTVVYKPRSVEAGATFYRTVKTVSTELSVPEFETPQYVASDGYGWMEWIEYRDCPDEDAVGRYYERVGVLLCLAYLFEFTDCHYENVVAAGEYPMILDAETVFHPYIDEDHDPGEGGSSGVTDDSVLLSLLLPFESGRPNGPVSDISVKFAGISVSSDPTEFEVFARPEVEAPNSDVMSIEHEQPRVEREENIPAIDGEDFAPDDYLDEILNGFTTVYEAAMNDSELDFVALAESFESVENRVVYRATREYVSHLRSLTAQDRLKDGAYFGVGMEELVVPFCTSQTTDPPWDIYGAEREALKRFDPPRFASRPENDVIYAHDEPIGETADRPGLERAIDRIKAPDESDLAEQREIIRGCLGYRPTTPRQLDDTDWQRADDERLREAAIGTYEAVRTAGTESESGRYDWTSVAPWHETDRLRIRPADHSLYVGRTGIALLGAALYSATGDEEYRQFARDTVAPTRQAVEDGRPIPSLQNHGGAFGVGSIGYGLSVVGDLVGDPELVETAADIANEVTPEFVENDDMHDVIGGSAGTILGLLGTYERSGDDDLVAAARRCGDHLLESSDETADGARTWETLDAARPLTGFAHGGAGIAYALARLAAITDDDRYRDAALEAITYESNTYDADAGNWPDFVDDSEYSYRDQWCHGRSGIGLARLGTAEYVEDDPVREGLERALDNVRGDALRVYDHPCCGNTGRAEFLLEAERRLDRRVGEATELLGGVLAHVGDDGTYRTTSATREITNPTFFLGQAGIGYTMLRATDPETLPSILLWE